MKRVVWIVLSLAVCVFSAHAERRVALVIGNATYADAPLKNPVNDARDMRERLKGLGFVDANIVYRENLKTGEIGALLREWRAKLTAGGDTVGLVFYAGHGVQIRGENYLPTVDARIEGEEDVPRQAVKLAEVMAVMAESRTRLNLVFLDACRNNPYARSFRDGTRGLAPERLPSGTLIAYATRPGAVAADGSGRNGVFTAQLLSHMATPGLTVDQVIRRVVRGVRVGTDSKQDPWTEGSIDEDFYLAQRTPEPVPSSPQPGPRVPPLQEGIEIDGGRISIRSGVTSSTVLSGEGSSSVVNGNTFYVKNGVLYVNGKPVSGTGTSSRSRVYNISVLSNGDMEIETDGQKISLSSRENIK